MIFSILEKTIPIIHKAFQILNLLVCRIEGNSQKSQKKMNFILFRNSIKQFQ